MPDWILVKSTGPIHDPALVELHPGEREAIVLASSLHAQFLLTDDHKARTAARHRGLPTLTTLLILDAAADRGLIVFTEALERLLQTNFRVGPLTIQQLLRKHLAK